MPKCNDECRDVKTISCNASTGRGFMCTRPPGHTGDHIACSADEHEIKIWANDTEFNSSATISATPLCFHANGWYNTIPGRFWGRRRVFVCTDCGDILEPEKKQESV